MSLRVRLLLGAVALFLVAACTDLAGGGEIVATLPPAAPTDEISLPPANPDLANGRRIFAENCTECHAANGSGQGDLVLSGEVPQMPSFLDAAHVREQSLAYYYDIITNGNLANIMPPWAEALSLQERWDVAMYVYTLHYTPEQIAQGEALGLESNFGLSLASDAELASALELEGEEAFAAVAYQRIQQTGNFDAAEEPLPESTAESVQRDFETVTFTGTVTNGSAGGSVPAGLVASLRYGNQADGLQEQSVNVAADNTFRFEDVPYEPTYQYFAAVTYQDRGFVSELLPAAEVDEVTDLSITLYETTSESSVVTQTGLQLIIEELDVADLGTGLVVTQGNLYENNSDRMFLLRPEGQNVAVSLLVQLPAGAVILTEDDPRYIVAQEQFAVIDQLPVYPGEHTNDAFYFIPYENSAVIDLPLNNRFDGEVSVTIISDTITLSGEGFSEAETLNLGTEDQPLIARRYTSTQEVASGESIIFQLQGQLSILMQDTGDSVITGDRLLLVLSFGALGVVFVVIAVMLLLRRGNSLDAQINKLQAQIAQLEKQHEAGEINHDVFQQKRRDLIEQVRELMEKQPDAE